MNRKTIKTALEKLDIVQWDRYIDMGKVIQIYGWIEREKDEYKDFVLLVYNIEKDNFGYTTSSPTYGKVIREKLSIPEGEATECQRVENFFEIENCIRLQNIDTY